MSAISLLRPSSSARRGSPWVAVGRRGIAAESESEQGSGALGVDDCLSYSKGQVTIVASGIKLLLQPDFSFTHDQVDLAYLPWVFSYMAPASDS